MRYKPVFIVTLTGCILLLSAFRPDKKTSFVESSEPTLLWETGQVLKTPESVIWCGQQEVIYVSNIHGNSREKDGNGFISKLGLDGSILQMEWATGLHAPKGMGILRGFLYVADIDRVVKISLEDGSIAGQFDFSGAKFLNDISVDTASGKIFVSDMADNQIYFIDGDSHGLFSASTALNRPNGLLVHDGRLLAGNNDFILSFDLTGSHESVLAGSTGPIDGLAGLTDQKFLISDWSGNVFVVDPGKEKVKILNLETRGINAADIWYISEMNILLVPTFLHNSVMAFKLPR